MIFLLLLSCNKGESPLPCLSVEEELEKLQTVKEKDYRFYKYIDNNNKILKTEYLVFDSKNNPIKKGTYINDSLVWHRIFEYKYY